MKQFYVILITEWNLNFNAFKDYSNCRYLDRYLLGTENEKTKKYIKVKKPGDKT